MKTVFKILMKIGGSKISKIMLKYAVYCLGFGMLKLSNCCLEDLKTWSNYNISWECIPLDSSQWKEGVFLVVLASMDLTECHRIAIPGDPMCGLYVIRKGHDHEAIYYFVKKTETGHRSSLFKCLPVQLRQQLSDTSCPGIMA